ncbi:CalY family protein [Ectobacillus sp. JY-23]|uniref:TasA family protein n=1 Tax=Ectobacillus sp. JY-23 TaxID=2933872 RepID=UPI001FF5A512|nr:TasA family protein [Ectobacillus sp. JY-23]UOY93318.1 CalY family protein [Ectobacillus sp. JY-23]
MSFFKTVSKGVMTASLGLALMGGGTLAYFSDKVETQNAFANGTLDLAVNPTAVVNISNLKPGDTVYREFTLTNSGSLDINKVLLGTKYEVENAQGTEENTDDLAKHIKVRILYNTSSATSTVVEKTLAELKDMTPDITAIGSFVGSNNETGALPIPDGIPADDGKGLGNNIEKLFVQFEFVDDGTDQNQFQGDTLKVDWTFNAQTGGGTEYWDEDPDTN